MIAVSGSRRQDASDTPPRVMNDYKKDLVLAPHLAKLSAQRQSWRLSKTHRKKISIWALKDSYSDCAKAVPREMCIDVASGKPLKFQDLSDSQWSKGMTADCWSSCSCSTWKWTSFFVYILAWPIIFPFCRSPFTLTSWHFKHQHINSLLPLKLRLITTKSLHLWRRSDVLHYYS